MISVRRCAALLGLILASLLIVAASASASAWDKPLLTSPTVIQVTEGTRNLRLDQSKDYTLTCDGKVLATWGLVVWGGRNVVVDGCDYANSSTSGAAVFKNQRGTLWLHDVHFEGASQSEGIDLQEPGTTTVVLRDVLIDPLVRPDLKTHTDLLQTWSGPQRLLIDGFTGTSPYQAFFMLPNQQDFTTVETTWDMRNVNVHLNPGGYVWTFGSQIARPVLYTSSIYADGPGQPLVFPGQGWQGALSGTPPTGDFVTATKTSAIGPDEVVDPMPFDGEH